MGGMLAGRGGAPSREGGFGRQTRYAPHPRGTPRRRTAGDACAQPAPSSLEPSAMLRFMLLFLLCLGVLFVAELLQPVDHYVILPFTAAIAKVCVWIVGLFDPHAIAYGKVLQST